MWQAFGLHEFAVDLSCSWENCLMMIELDISRVEVSDSTVAEIVVVYDGVLGFLREITKQVVPLGGMRVFGALCLRSLALCMLSYNGTPYICGDSPNWLMEKGMGLALSDVFNLRGVLAAAQQGQARGQIRLAPLLLPLLQHPLAR